MKFYRWNKHYLGWGITAFIVIIASLIVFTMLSNMSSIASAIGGFISVISPIFYGFVIAYLLAPIVEVFEKKVFGKVFKKSVEHYEDKDTENRNSENGEKKHRHLKIYIKNRPARICSIAVTFVLFIGIIIGILVAIIPQLGTTFSLLVDNLPSYMSNVSEWITDAFSNFPEIAEELTAMVNDAGTTLKNFLNTTILPQMGSYLGFLTSGIMSVIGTILNLIFGIVVAIYCLYSKELFAAQAKKTLYCILPMKTANRFISSVRKVHRSFGNFITGTIIDSFVVCCITFVVTTFSGVPFALLVSVIMGVTNIIPYFGPFIGLIPSLFLIFMESPFMCIIFAIIVVIIQNVNGNIISPRILGESTGLTSFWVIFAILAGQAIFGFWGLIIGIPLFAVIYSAAKTFVSDKLRRKGFPSGSDDYTDIDSFVSEEGEIVPVSLSDRLEKEKAVKAAKEAEQKARRKKELEAKKKSIEDKIKAVRNQNKKK
jgi:predicted PurR-regulated permease PerM